ncbi:MAG: fused MFS/spermidine synthase [Gemmatimonadaceae bacterium]
MTFPLLMAVVALAGFVSLSYELLWLRAFSFASRGAPDIFGRLLFYYLAGLAIGAFASRIFCHERNTRGDPRRLLPLAAFVYLANLVGFLVLPALGWLATSWGWEAALPLVAIGSASWGSVLPLVSHFGVAPDALAGARLSYLYLANILGSVAGTLITGFLLFDRWPLVTCALLAVLLGLGLAGALIVAGRAPDARRRLGLGAVIATAAVFIVTAQSLFHRFYERLLGGPTFRAAVPAARIVENRHGVIAVTANGDVFGGGAYDGAISTSLLHDRNMIVRAYGLAALHDRPRDVLLIGLSTGAWAQVIANMPGVQKLTVVEINPGYLGLIPRFAQVASLLRNPKVEIVIDDGRRWLARHPDRAFDVIVSNTTFHWRSNVTNLLSTEFLQLIRRHLKPGGIFHFNATESADVYRTAFTVFPHGLRFINFVTVSDTPIAIDAGRFRSVLDGETIDGVSVLNQSSAADRQRRSELLALLHTIDGPPVRYGLEWRDALLSRMRSGSVITDDNMLPEWRGTNDPLYPPR